MADEQDEKSYKERIDPGGEFERRAAGLEALASFAPVRWLLKHRGMDTDELLDRIREQRQNITELTSAPDRVAAVLSPRGWPYFSGVPHDAYVAAASLAEQGKVDDAEELIVEAWNENDVMLRWPLSASSDSMARTGTSRRRRTGSDFWKKHSSSIKQATTPARTVGSTAEAQGD